MGDVWAGIVRVSHMGARKADAPDFHSERDQVNAIEAAVPDGGKLKVLPAELDVSGGLPLDKRPSLRNAVEGVERGDYAGIIVAYQSRLGRDTEYEEGVWRRVEKAGGRIIMALDGLDTTTADGKMVRRIRSAINHAERERHVERFDALRAEATKLGIWQRRQKPKGYDKDPRTRALVPNGDADRVRAAFRRRAASVPISTIATELGMTTSGARALLRNRVYLGELHVGQYVNRAAHPPLVTVEEWEAAQSNVPRPGRSATLEPALLAGIVRCQACGHAMSRSRAAAVVYVCYGSSSAGRCPAPAGITTALLDKHVAEIARQELQRLSVQARGRSVDVDGARERLAAAERELAAYVEAISVEDVGAQAFAAGSRKRREGVDDAREELRRRLAMRPVGPEFDSGAEVWDALDGHGRNALLRALLEVVVVRRAGGRGARTPLAERVRVVRYGAGIVGRRVRNGSAAGINPLPFLDPDDERVLGVTGSEDRL